MSNCSHEQLQTRLETEGLRVGVLLTWLFGISSRETSFERRGFRGGSPAVRARLEQVGAAFALGYRAALEDSRSAPMVSKLEAAAPEFRGFAFEGAAMGLALRDWLTPWNRNRVARFLSGAGEAHVYMVHV